MACICDLPKFETWKTGMVVVNDEMYRNLENQHAKMNNGHGHYRASVRI